MTIQITILIEEIKEPTKGKGGKKYKPEKESRIKAGYGTYTPPDEEEPDEDDICEDDWAVMEAPPMEVQIKRTRNPFKMGRI